MTLLITCTFIFSTYIYLIREDLSSIQERLKIELSNKEEAISALKVLQDEQEKEKIAREHSQKLTNSRHQMILQTEYHRKQSAIIIQKRWRHYYAKVSSFIKKFVINLFCRKNKQNFRKKRIK